MKTLRNQGSVSSTPSEIIKKSNFGIIFWEDERKKIRLLMMVLLSASSKDFVYLIFEFSLVIHRVVPFAVGDV
jgi:hypothetical protein